MKQENNDISRALKGYSKESNRNSFCYNCKYHAIKCWTDYLNKLAFQDKICKNKWKKV